MSKIFANENDRPYLKKEVVTRLFIISRLLTSITGWSYEQLSHPTTTLEGYYFLSPVKP